MECNVWDHAGMVCQCVYKTLVCNIPQLDSPIIWTGSDHSWIKWKLRASYPVWMAFKTLNELAFLHIPDFDQFVIRGWDQHWTILVEFNRFHWGWMSFHNCTLCTCIIVPDSYCVISRYGSNQCSKRVYRNISDGSCMAYKFIRSSIRPQSPCKD